jgi:uncharacterized protein (TIRG00374 family)
MSITNWWLVGLAISIDVLTYVVQGVRWKLLLAPIGRLSTMRATQYIYAGLFTNELVPLRFGEVVRAYLASRWLSIDFTAVVPSMVIERFLDAFWLAAGIGLAAIFLPLPQDVIKAGVLLAGIVLLAALLFLYIGFRHDKRLKWGESVSSSRIVSEVWRFAMRLASGFDDIGSSYRIYLAALLSAAMLFCQVLALWFMLLACRLPLPLAAGAMVLLVVRLGTSIPNAPANIGSFQFFCVLALNLFGVEKAAAAGFSVVYFLALTVPLWIIGLIAISRAGMSLSMIRLGASAFPPNPGRA